MLPETCAPKWPKEAPGQIAIIGPGAVVNNVDQATNRIQDKQIIFPQNNYGWIHIKVLPPGDYTFYVQFAGEKPGKGLEKITLTTYGLNQCAAMIESG